MDLSKIASFVLFGIALGTNSHAAENPILTTGVPYVLSIPSVDYSGIPGFYQKAMIEYSPQTQAWRLVSYIKGVPIQQVTTVELIQTQVVPVQVFLKISGGFPNTCPQVGSVGMRLDNNKFDVYLYYLDESIHPPAPTDCSQIGVPFTKVIPLPVYSLPAGMYDYNFNDKFAGSFTLSVDNKLP